MNEEMRIPVAVGVTGHRNLNKNSEPLLREAVRTELHRLRELAPHSPFVLLSSLAEGADLLCAEVALGEGYRLCVPLPMPEEEFIAAFDAESAGRYRELVSKADSVFVVPEVEAHRDGKDFLYRQASIYAAKHCHVLLALWDGVPGTEDGCGTAETVGFKLHGSFSPKYPQTLPAQMGAVIHILTRRDSDTSDAADAPQVTRLQEDAMLRSIKETDAFNQEAASKGSPPADESGDHTMRRIRSLYAAADKLSVKNAKAHHRVIALLSIAATVLTMAFLLYDEMMLHWMILVCGAMILSLFLIRFVADRMRCHRKYTEYRLLAEGLRVQSFLTEAGLSAEVCDLLPWSWQVNMPWIKDALAVSVIGGQPSVKRSVRRLWMKDQLDYHRKALKKAQAEERANRIIIRCAVGLSILSYLLALVFEIVYGGLFGGVPLLPFERLESSRTILKIIMGSLSAITLFAGNYYGKLSLDETINDHKRMAYLYEMALTTAEQKGESEEFLCQLAREALSENSSWYAYQSTNKPDISL